MTVTRAGESVPLVLEGLSSSKILERRRSNDMVSLNVLRSRHTDSRDGRVG